MFCQECGRQSEGGSEFCQHCGATLTGIKAKATVAKKSNKKFIPILTAVLLVIIAGGFYWFYFHGQGIPMVKESSGLFPVYQNGKRGYIDKTGKIVINPQFDDARHFTEGLASVNIGDKWGYIDKAGKIVWNSAD